MKKLPLIILFVLATLGQTVWAQGWIEVDNASDLNSNIANGAYIKLTADITLPAYLKIGENSSQTVHIDLNGHRLSRNLSALDANGHVIEVFGAGTLTLQNGTLSGGRYVLRLINGEDGADLRQGERDA